MIGWTTLIWLGIAVAAVALVVNAVVLRQGFGGLFWLVAVPVAVAAVVAWRATGGSRATLMALSAIAVVVVLAGGVAVAFVVALSSGQTASGGVGSDLLAWGLPALGGVAILIGALRGLRASTTR